MARKPTTKSRNTKKKRTIIIKSKIAWIAYSLLKCAIYKLSYDVVAMDRLFSLFVTTKCSDTKMFA